MLCGAYLLIVIRMAGCAGIRYAPSSAVAFRDALFGWQRDVGSRRNRAANFVWM